MGKAGGKNRLKAASIRHKLVIAAACVVLVLGAAAVCRRSPDCFVAEHVAIIDHATVEGRPLWLVHRITGWHDKVEFVEIYAGAPAFDSCGRASLQPLSVDALDEAQGKVRTLAIRDDKVVLEYTRNAAEATDLSRLKIPRR